MLKKERLSTIHYLYNDSGKSEKSLYNEVVQDVFKIKFVETRYSNGEGKIVIKETEQRNESLITDYDTFTAFR